MSIAFWINTKDKPGLFYALIQEFSNKGRVSFEGDLKELDLSTLPGATKEAKRPLSKVIYYPRPDFISIPLTTETIPQIWKEVNEKDHLNRDDGIVHVQIEHDGKLVFCAYDNFDKDCTAAYEGVPRALLERLKANGVIRDYEEFHT